MIKIKQNTLYNHTVAILFWEAKDALIDAILTQQTVRILPVREYGVKHLPLLAEELFHVSVLSILQYNCYCHMGGDHRP